MMNFEKLPKKHAMRSVAVTCKGFLERVKDHRDKNQNFCRCSMSTRRKN